MHDALAAHVELDLLYRRQQIHRRKACLTGEASIDKPVLVGQPPGRRAVERRHDNLLQRAALLQQLHGPRNMAGLVANIAAKANADFAERCVFHDRLLFLKISNTFSAAACSATSCTRNMAAP